MSGERQSTDSCSIPCVPPTTGRPRHTNYSAMVPVAKPDRGHDDNVFACVRSSICGDAVRTVGISRKMPLVFVIVFPEVFSRPIM